MAAILDGEGTQVAIAVLTESDEQGVLIVEQVMEGRGRLVQLYFGRGLRNVFVEHDGVLAPGTLQTRWHGRERLWKVRLTPLDASNSPARPTADAAANPDGRRWAPIMTRATGAGRLPSLKLMGPLGRHD